MLSPSSMEVSAMIPKDVMNTPRSVFEYLAADFSNAVTPPPATMILTIPPMSAMTSTVNTLSLCPMVSITESANPANTPVLYTRIAAMIPDTIRDSTVRLVIRTYMSIRASGMIKSGADEPAGTRNIAAMYSTARLPYCSIISFTDIGVRFAGYDSTPLLACESATTCECLPETCAYTLFMNSPYICGWELRKDRRASLSILYTTVRPMERTVERRC